MIMFALFSASCTVRPKDVASPVALPARFSATGHAALPDKWWQAFNDEALNGLCERALSGNFSLQAAYSRLKQAKAVAIKTGADLIPQVNANMAASHATLDSSGFNDFALGLVASYEVDLWGRIRSALQAAQLDAKSAEEDIFSAAISLSAEVASTWYRLMEQRQQLQLLDRQIEVNRNYVTLIKVRFNLAQATAADVFQQQQLLESVIGNRHTVAATIAVLQNQLAVLTGQPPGALAIANQTGFPLLPPLPETGLSASVMQRRPDIRKAYLAVQSADLRVASAIADRLPKLSLSANTEGSSPNFQSLLNNWLATVAGNLVLPLVDGKRRVAEVERNRALTEEALNNYAALLLNAAREIENALAQERQQVLLVENLKHQVKLAQQASDIIRLRYLNGAVDFLRVLTALLTQQNLERSLLQNQQQLYDYRISLYRALAGRFTLPGKGSVINDTKHIEKTINNH